MQTEKIAVALVTKLAARYVKLKNLKTEELTRKQRRDFARLESIKNTLINKR